MSNLDEIEYLHKQFDIYQDLLTPKQREYFELYYFEDLSLSEIAEELNVSRNAVHNNLNATVAHLNNYESKLKNVEKTKIVRIHLNDLAEKYQINREDIEKIEELL